MSDKEVGRVAVIFFIIGFVLFCVGILGGRGFKREYEAQNISLRDQLKKCEEEKHGKRE